MRPLQKIVTGVIVLFILVVTVWRFTVWDSTGTSNAVYTGLAIALGLVGSLGILVLGRKGDRIGRKGDRARGRRGRGQ